MKLRDTVTIFHYKYAKKIIGSFLEMLSDIIFSGGTTAVYAKTTYQCSRENYTQLANLSRL
jgi:hypothetical protein